MNLPPAVLVGAETVNAISIIRSLAEAGVDVYLLCHQRALNALSRYARRIPVPDPMPERPTWADFLLGQASHHLRGAVVLACNDDAIELLLEHHDDFAQRYRLDACHPPAQRAMLDKLATYRAAAEAGVATPRFWAAPTLEEVHAHRQEYTFPLLVKPVYSHLFKRAFTGKYLRAESFNDLVAAVDTAVRHGIEVMLLEEIPGPDDLLCSYYTYLDEKGEPQFHFTKRIIRRFPEHEGFACYHVTDWNPEVRDLGLRLFRHVGLQGVANVEFKRDPRDGRLKLIECNARFTAANGLLTAAGYDLGRYVYYRAASIPQRPLGDRPYAKGMRLWYPVTDLRAFLQLRREGRLDLPSWVRGVSHRQVLPYFSWKDPLPSAVLFERSMRNLVAGELRRRSGPRARDGG